MKLSEFTSIRNIGIKTLLAFFGVFVIVADFWPFISAKFFWTDREAPVWVFTDWILLMMGFFLAIGGVYYNTVAEAIATNIKSKKI